MKQTITKIVTPLISKVQWVYFYSKERKVPTPFCFTFQSLFEYIQKTYSYEIQVVEIELLLNSTLEAVYYKKGEKRPNGKITRYENSEVKSYKLQLSETIEHAKAANLDNILSFQTVYDSHIFTRKNRKAVRIRTTTDSVYFIGLSELLRLTGLQENELGLLSGAFISPVFYKVGEFSDSSIFPIYEDNKIIKDLNLRVTNSIDYNYKITANQHLSKKERPFQDVYLNRDLPQYTKYGGYNGFDDASIDNAFEGDVEATWNVD